MPSRNPAWQEFFENYFSFSRSQRRAIVVMVLFTATFIVYSRWTLVDAVVNEPFVVTEIAVLDES